MNKLTLLTAGLLLAGLSSCSYLDEFLEENKTRKPPLVIGHRGASGYLPEHTLASYKLAIDQGADYIEPDVVLTKDLVLVCRHEPVLSGTTNVAQLPQFADRKTTKSIDGVSYDDWFASDFTLAEIKTLKAKQAFAERPQQYNDLYSIPTFAEVIELAKTQAQIRGRVVGIYPETKHPTFHEDLGLPITDKVLEALTKAGWNNKQAPVFVQSFEVANLQYIRRKSTVKLVQLFDAYDVDKNGNLVMEAPNGQPYDFVVAGDPRTYNDLATDQGLDFIKTYANGIGPWKPFIQPYTFTDAANDGAADDINGDGQVNDADFTKLPATTLIRRAHQRGLVVHAYTFRNESRRLLSDYQNDPGAEYKNFYGLGIDGVFTDFPDAAVAARRK
ncbi:MAG: glycerophosphodiester phosphodiesterase [Ferruginibacter sp.]|nr:glycerophosphodiester phosphodiesterase [Cytophagales bacterium]